MHNETQVMNDEDNANDEMTNEVGAPLQTSIEHS